MSETPLEKGHVISLEKTVEWVDTDASGHQHNSVVIRWVEAAEAQLMRELELPEYFPNAPRVQHVVNFTGMLWFGQEARVDLWVQDIGRTSLIFGFEVVSSGFGSSPGGRVASGSVTVVYVPQGETGAHPWPADMLRKLEQVSA